MFRVTFVNGHGVEERTSAPAGECAETGRRLVQSVFEIDFAYRGLNDLSWLFE